MNYSLNILTCFFCIFFSISQAQAEVFKWVDQNGQVHYSDKKPTNQKVETFKVKPHNQVTENSHPDSTDSPTQIEPKPVAKKPYKKKQKVTMYSASWCGYCKKARAYFKKNKIKYVEYDIEKNLSANKRYQKLGGKGVPLLVAKRKTMQGFSPSNFENWYNSL